MPDMRQEVPCARLPVGRELLAGHGLRPCHGAARRAGAEGLLLGARRADRCRAVGEARLALHTRLRLLGDVDGQERPQQEASLGADANRLGDRGAARGPRLEGSRARRLEEARRACAHRRRRNELQEGPQLHDDRGEPRHQHRDMGVQGAREGGLG